MPLPSERTLDVWFVDCKEENLSSATGGQFYLGKRIDKNKHEGMGTRCKNKINQDADNPDRKVEWFLKVHKRYELLWEAYP